MYKVFVEGELVYVGSGSGNRYKHATSGASHVVELNRHVLTGDTVEVVIDGRFSTKQDSMVVEQNLIDKFQPVYNKRAVIAKNKYSNGTTGHLRPFPKTRENLVNMLYNKLEPARHKMSATGVLGASSG